MCSSCEEYLDFTRRERTLGVGDLSSGVQEVDRRQVVWPKRLE